MTVELTGTQLGLLEVLEGSGGGAALHPTVNQRPAASTECYAAQVALSLGCASPPALHGWVLVRPLAASVTRAPSGCEQVIPG